LHDRSEGRRVGNGSTKPFFKRRKIYVALNRFRDKESYAIVSRIKFSGLSVIVICQIWKCDQDQKQIRVGAWIKCQSAEKMPIAAAKMTTLVKIKRDRSRSSVGLLIF